MKILIVDDSAFMRNMIKNILKDTNHEMVEAGNADDAVNMYKEHQPTLTFLDIIMPDKNGVEALKEIKATNPNANVIMCTSVGQDQIVQECVTAGASDFITKPFTPDEIKGVVSKFDAQ